MRDIRIKWKWIVRELIILLSLYVLINIINVLAIILYGTPWNEVFTSQGYVLFITEWVYIAFAAARLLLLGIRYLLKKKQT